MVRSQLIPGRGRLAARVSHPSLPYPTNVTGLFYSIEIPVGFDLNPVPEDPEFFPHKDARGLPKSDLRLDHISLGLTSWRSLSGQEFAFPVNPAPGYIDGSIYLQATHNWADATRLRFGGLQPSAIALSLDVAVDFSMLDAAPAALASAMPVTWEVILDVDVAELDRQMTLAQSLLAG